MGPGDLFTAAAILAAAGWILYRSLLRKEGGCHGCSGCSHGRPPETPLVRLGAAPRPHDGGDRDSSRCGP